MQVGGDGLTDKIHVLEQLGSGMSYAAIGCEFSANEAATYSKQGVFEKQHALYKNTY